MRGDREGLGNAILKLCQLPDKATAGCATARWLHLPLDEWRAIDRATAANAASHWWWWWWWWWWW